MMSMSTEGGILFDFRFFICRAKKEQRERELRGETLSPSTDEDNGDDKSDPFKRINESSFLKKVLFGTLMSIPCVLIYRFTSANLPDIFYIYTIYQDVKSSPSRKLSGFHSDDENSGFEYKYSKSFVFLNSSIACNKYKDMNIDYCLLIILHFL